MTDADAPRPTFQNYFYDACLCERPSHESAAPPSRDPPAPAHRWPHHSLQVVVVKAASMLSAALITWATVSGIAPSEPGGVAPIVEHASIVV